MKSLDRRVRRTRRLLRDALIALILEKGYESILVQDITDRADLSRATFYLHYKDKEELLTACLEEMFDELVARMPKPATPTEALNAREAALFAFRHAQEHQHFYRVLINERVLASVMNRVREYLATEVEKRIHLLIAGQAMPAVPITIVAHFIGGALFSLLVWWLQNRMPESPERMADLFSQLVATGLAGSFSQYEGT